MAFKKISNAEMNTHGVRGLPDTPNLSAYDMQKKFDELATDVLRPAHDQLIDDLEDVEAASNIGAIVPFGMVAGDNVQSVIDNLATVSHSHDNKEILDGFNKDDEGNLIHDGKTIASKSFSTVKIDGIEINAEIDDVLEFLAGENITLIPNVTDKSITVSMTNSDEKVYVMYSAFADGTDFEETPASTRPYMGICFTLEDTAPANKEAYKWILTGIETQDIPQFNVNWETGELEYTGQTYTFYTDEDGYLHWGVI